MAKKIRVWDGTQWQDVAPSLPYTAIHSAQASMPATGVDGQVWLDTDGTLAGQDFVPLSGGTMTGNLNVPSINSGPIVGRNKILNGDFSIWQRGASFTSPSDNSFTADRWRQNGNGTIGTRIWSRESFSSGEIPEYNPQYFMRFNQSVAGSGASYQNILIQPIEDVRTFAGQVVTISFWAKADVAGRTIAPLIYRFFGSGSPTPADSVSGTIFSLTTTWQRYSSTITIPSISGKTISSTNHAIQLILTPTFNIAQVIDIWGVQMEAGNQATPFHTATPNQQTELAACQRYFQTLLNGSDNNYENFGVSTFWSSNRLLYNIRLPIVMRVTPSISISAVGDFVIENGPIGANTATNYDTFDLSPRHIAGSFYCAGTPYTAGHSGRIRANGTANARVYLSAEL